MTVPASPSVGPAWRRLVGYYAALAAVGLANSVLGPTLPGLAAQTGATLSQISLLFVARAAGYLSGSWVIGRLYDRLPGHPIMIAALLALGLGLAATPLSPWLGLLAALLLLIGLAEAGTDIGVNTLLVWTYGDAVGPYLNGLHFAFGLGAALAPVVVAQVSGLPDGLRWAYWGLAGLVLVPALWVLRLPSPPLRAAASASRGGQAARAGLVALFVVCFFFYVGAETAFGAWVYTYAERLRLADPAAAAYLSAAFWGALTVGRLVSIPLATRVRPRLILAAALGGCLVSVGLVPLLPASPAALWAGTLGTGFCMAPVFPTLLAFASRRLPLTARITSLFFIGSNVGGTVLPWLVGQLVEPFGPRLIMAVVFAGVVLDGLAFLALMRLAPNPADSAR